MRKPVSLIVLGCVVAACSPDAPAATTSPDATPSAVVTSDGATPGGSAGTPGATGSAGSGASVDPSQDPLYLEAVEVYRAYHAEMAKLESAGFPEPTLPPIMDRYITGTMKDAVADAYRQSNEAGLKLKDGKPSVLSAVAPNPGVSRDGSVTSLRLCSDGSKSTILDANGAELGPGALVYKTIYFKKFDGQLKAFLSEAEEVESCPLS